MGRLSLSPSYPFAMRVNWTDPLREQACMTWLTPLADPLGLHLETLAPASSDASFRRYLQLKSDASPTGRYIVMDAPPELENNPAFVKVAGLMAEAGLRVPQILSWDQAHGFMLLSDLGEHTLMHALTTQPEAAHLPLWRSALEALRPWQLHAVGDALPAYDHALLQRELSLFPDWYIAKHKAYTLSDSERSQWQSWFDLIVSHNLQAPSVPVHRDFMPRNLMLPASGDDPRMGVLDFQDAVFGPITYDLASLMRDAFISWEEEVVMDVTIRHWEQLRKTGLIDAHGWSEDFGAFYEAIEWMGLQRHLKVAGIFARLTLRDGKEKYLADAPRFIGYIRRTASRYSALTPLLRAIDRIEGIAPQETLVMGRG
ncbi:MAG: hypothetical protein RL307_750 [Pseudomonadota bacterium]|jgi:aminoglycoside/choline kinase family phosphotransferase